VPLREIVIGELGALLVTVTVPAALPLVVGANFAVKVLFWPELIVSGVVIPVTLNPVPDALTAETVTLAVPEFVSVIVCDPLLPTAILPKLTVVGLADSCPCTPVPLRAIVAGDPGALLEIETLPLTLPLAVGANFTVNVEFCPVLIVRGVVTPLTLYPVPETLTAETVRLAVPELVSVIVWDPLLPTVTLPKATLVGLTESCA